MSAKKLFAASLVAGVVTTDQAAAAPAVVEQTALETAVTAQVQTIRRGRGLPSLRFSPTLTAGARARARDMARRGYFSHTDPSGTPFWVQVMRFYPSRGWRAWKIGENLLWTAPPLDANTVVRRWLESPPHRDVLLRANWRDVGAAAVRVTSARGVYAGQNVTIVALEFGVRN
jgi:uncharacterized protein YkwD